MIKLRKLNSRLLIAFSVLSTVVCLFFIQFSLLLVEQTKENTFHQILVSEAVKIEQAHIISGEIKIIDSSIIKIYQNEEELLAILPDQASSLINYNGALLNIEPYLVLRHELTPLMPIWLVINKNTLDSVTNVTDYMMLFLYSIVAGVILLTFLSSWYLAKLLSLPIQRLTESIVEKKQSAHAELYGRNRSDEIGTLSRSFEEAFNELEQVLKREQNFTRDVSHELRTPITLIKNTLSLSNHKPIDKSQADILQQASQELEQTVEVLLALARQENLIFEPCLILPIIEKTILSIYNSYPQLVFDVNIDLSLKLEVVGNPYLISLLCQNLVNNGFYHGAGGSMVVYSQDNAIIFENSITKDKARPYYQGLGHGQYLVTRIAEEMNWGIEIEQSIDSYKVILTPLIENN
ncbi:HAMP domain-containing sensor histidine kinase [Colwellia sp. 1_MG-2023]|uniref:sensor histidine kinase n=1 Tax=Colwellia sp. 1_MG-2023 TaxID=3062649 RepID=UPI0026E4569D|nr:HAMP domain-containing sensor histidine kinase [Colwellia sp. 1_MG-2023]MDO6447030.1 HAMP domain-containing sensor histidine kinase [Colwellia sp. 1_MG-2023]